MRRFGEVAKPGIHYKRRLGAYAILPIDGCVLLTEQADPEPDIQLPGGGVDPGESPIAALHREVFEETGWHIASVRRMGVYRRFAYMPEYDLWAEKICLIYFAQPIYSKGPPLESGHTALLLSPSVAKTKLGDPGFRHFCAEFFS